MPYKDLQKRKEYVRLYYSSEEQKQKKQIYDQQRYQKTRRRYKESRSRASYPHRFIYSGEWVCGICGSDQLLEIHHKDFNHSNNDQSNLQCLCASCHAKLHIAERERDEKGKVVKSTNKIKGGKNND